MNPFKCLLDGKDNMPADTPDFAAFIEGSMAGLQLTNEAHQGMWRMGEAERWDFNQQDGLLLFTFTDGLRAQSPAQIIGSYDSQSETWLWAWANSSLHPHLTVDAQKIKAYGEQHKIAKLTTPRWAATQTDGWQMTAVAMRLCEASGAYRGPAGSTFIFFTFGEVQLSKSNIAKD